MTAITEEAQPELADPRLLRLILRLAGPAIIGISAHSLQMAVNAIFVAGLGQAAVAAVALTQSATLAIAALGYGIGIGAASLVARRLGERDCAAAGEAAATALVMAAPAALLSALMLVDIDSILSLLGASPAVVHAAHGYAILSVIGTIVMLVHIVGGFIARAEASARFSMVVMVGSFGLNIVLDVVFILGMGAGIEGAGWATLLGQIAAALAYFYYFADRVSTLVLRFDPHRAARFAREIVAIGAPATATTLLTTFSLAVMLAAASRAGEAAVAGLAVALRVLGFGMLPVLGLCSGAEAVFGFAHGARDHARLESALRIVLGVAVAYSVAWSAATILFARPLLSPFAPDAETLDLAIRASDVLEIVFALSAIAYVALTLFQAIGAPRRAAALSLAAQGYALLPLLAVLPGLWGFDGVIASRALAEAASCAIAAALLLRRGER